MHGSFDTPPTLAYITVKSTGWFFGVWIRENYPFKIYQTLKLFSIMIFYFFFFFKKMNSFNQLNNFPSLVWVLSLHYRFGCQVKSYKVNSYKVHLVYQKILVTYKTEKSTRMQKHFYIITKCHIQKLKVNSYTRYFWVIIFFI